MRTRSASAAMLAAFCLAAVAAMPEAQARKRPRPARTWQQVASVDDRERLRLWRDAWLEGLRQARAGGAGARIAAAGVLLDPDAALPGIVLPDGGYRCRMIKLGSRASGGAAFAEWPVRPCRLSGGRFAIAGGMQRPAGRLYPYDGSRLVFLGAMAVGDEIRVLDYGRDDTRDMIGMIERIGPSRWRLVLPKPRWESQIDVVEIVPADG